MLWTLAVILLVLWALGHGITWFLDGLTLWMFGYTLLAGSILIPAQERQAHNDYVAEWRKGF